MLFLSPLRLAIWSGLNSALAAEHMTLGPANNEPGRESVYALIREIRLETEMILLDNQAYNIYAGVRSTERIPGDMPSRRISRWICELDRRG